ncbi:hypothetical protein [Mycobacterium sp. shizuoka-1]|uniref:hypothetical protein n=1 Tax=Mycobacterium sp. shizuoka-1 TaxID=2039281 RepID=UPI000C05D1A2|nr:hypothetical protein [Mycobacterium sp. shizuoka-1]GAY17763.1 hypothetical protein MSZK_44890 [Mycobacterium sp. shizuoka-1]
MGTSAATAKALAFGLVGAVAVSLGIGVAAQASATPIQKDCCESEFDWAAPYADALRIHGLENLISTMGIGSALAMEDACGLVPAIGPVATVEKLARDYNISPGSAGKLLVAAADVCPNIGPLLG